MTDVLLSSLSLLLDWTILASLMVGALGGVIIGAIPGVGPAVAIAILLPATFSMEPLNGLILLLGIYGSSMYGGSLPAILINTPGTAVNALTTYDGYPMTKRGEARRALGLAYGASFLGAVVSIIALILLSPVLAKIAPMFGSREIFLACVLGIVLVIVAHKGQMAAAGMLAGFGILMQTVGMEPVKYTFRYTFDLQWLTSGFDLIVVVLGLFAVSQAYLLMLQPEQATKIDRVEGGMAKSLLQIFKFKRVVATGSGFGVMMGMIPGVGEFTAQFLSYTNARRKSSTPEEFGKGSPEGLVAAESANNAVPAAAMIPLLALGIPGEALTAMMLSVFYIHNVVPGPNLFANQLDFVYALFIGLLAINVIVVAAMLVSSNLLIRLIKIPTRFLGVAILTLSFVGLYSLRNSVVDCMIGAAFGVLGLILKRLNLPIIPIILGMVLGGIMEVKLRAASVRLDTPLDLVSRPICALIALAIVVIIFMTIRSSIRNWRKT